MRSVRAVRPRLATYIDDHLLGAFVAEELVMQCLERGFERHRPVLEAFLEELREDRRELLAVQSALGFRTALTKLVAGRIGGRLGRIGVKEKGLFFSPASNFLALEQIATGIDGKHALWLSFRVLAPNDERLRAFDFAGLAHRAERQRQTIEGLRRDAARLAFVHELHVPEP